jgi:hypothetical protein
MKKIILISLSFSTLLVFSCKKCYNCEKKCGTCTKNGFTVAGCDGDSTLQGYSVDTWKVYLEGQGYQCQYANPVSAEACGADNKDSYSKKGYTCTSK